MDQKTIKRNHRHHHQKQHPTAQEVNHTFVRKAGISITIEFARSLLNPKKSSTKQSMSVKDLNIKQKSLVIIKTTLLIMLNGSENFI